MKKELFIIGLLIFAIGLSGCTTSSKYTEGAPTGESQPLTGNGETTGSQTQTQGQQGSEGSEAKVYKFNEPFVIDDLQYTFKGAVAREELGQYVLDNFMGSKADGMYFIVELEIKNVGKKASYLSSSNIKIIDDQQREFETDTTAEMYLSMDDEFKGAETFVFDKLNPGLARTGYLVFDIPEDLKGIIQVVDNAYFPTEVTWVRFGE